MDEERERVKKRSRPALSTAALLVSSIVVSLATVEVILRVIAHSEDARVHAVSPDLESFQRLESVFDLAKKNQRGVFKGRFYRTNSAGFRGPEYARGKPPATVRIVVIGDSVTMGESVDESETYSARVEHALNASGTGRYEVLNLGISGLNVRHSLDRLERTGLAFEPDLIVYGFTINDLEGLPGYRKTTDAEKSPSLPLAIWNLAKLGYASFRDITWPSRSSYLYELNENFLRNPEVWGSFRENLAELAETGASSGICAVVLIHAQLAHLGRFHPFHPHYAKVAQAAAEFGMTPVETFPFVANRASDDLTISRLDPHPNAEGHRVFAEALLAGLRDLPLSCWKGRRPGVAMGTAE